MCQLSIRMCPHRLQHIGNAAQFSHFDLIVSIDCKTPKSCTSAALHLSM